MATRSKTPRATAAWRGPTVAGLPNLEGVPLTTGARTQLLESSAAWSGEFEWKEIEALSVYTAAFKAAKGTLIVTEGSREQYMGIVIAGQVDVKKRRADGNQRTIAQIGPGKTFGEMSLVDGEPRSASIVAATDSTLLIIKKEHVDRIRKEAPGIGFKLFFKVSRILSQRLRQTSSILADALG